MRILQGGAVLASAAALLFTAACGSSSDKTSSASSASAGPGMAAFTDCLRQHGVTIPTSRPTARPSGNASGRPGGGFFGGDGADRQALQACRSLAPRRPGRGVAMQALQAYRSCLSDHGVKLPTPAPGAARTPGAPRTPGMRRSPGAGMFGLNTADPKVAKAVKTCRPLLPSLTPRPSAS
jgi:hypothetical protein